MKPTKFFIYPLFVLILSGCTFTSEDINIPESKLLKKDYKIAINSSGSYRGRWDNTKDFFFGRDIHPLTSVSKKLYNYGANDSKKRINIVYDFPNDNDRYSFWPISGLLALGSIFPDPPGYIFFGPFAIFDLPIPWFGWSTQTTTLDAVVVEGNKEIRYPIQDSYTRLFGSIWFYTNPSERAKYDSLVGSLNKLYAQLEYEFYDEPATGDFVYLSKKKMIKAAEKIFQRLNASKVLNRDKPYIMIISEKQKQDRSVDLPTKDFLSQLQKLLVQKGNVEITNIQSNEMIMETRKLRNSDEVKQSTVSPKGKLIAPELNLFVSIQYKELSYGRVDYHIFISITRLSDGIVIWQDEMDL